MNKNTTRILGFWAAIIAIVVIFIYATLQLLTDLRLISGVRESIFLFLPPLFLAPIYLLMVLCLHYSVEIENKIWSALGLIFASLYCGQIIMLYILQFALPFKGIEQGHSLLYNGFLNPYDFLVTVDVLTYFFTSLSALFLAIALKDNVWVYRSLLWLGILVPIVLFSLIYPLVYFAGVFWIVSFTIAMLQIAFFFRIVKKKSNQNIGV